ncbi:MAG TPA: hypothetical protein VLW85_05435 [Myxococcales bacterium]|nr:hypothetical protein [Myxococcales bacterium]
MMPPAGAAAARPSPDEQPRALSAVLRWRARRLFASLPKPQARALRLFPVLFHANFPNAALKKGAPGVAGMQFRRGWIALSRAAGLDPPSSMCRAVFSIDAVLARPGAAGMQVLILAGRGMHARVAERLEAVMPALGTAAQKWNVHICEPDGMDELTLAGVAMLDSLVAGQIPAWTWQQRPARALGELPVAARLAPDAPPAAAISLMLLAAGPSPDPVAALRQALRGGTSARVLSDPAQSCAHWAGNEAPPELSIAQRWWRGEGQPTALEALLVGRALAVACARAVRRCTRSSSAGLRRQLRAQILAPGVPLALVPAVRAAEIEPRSTVRAGSVFEVHAADGSVLGRGRSQLQADARAIALAGSAGNAAGASPLHGLADRIARPAEAETLLLAVNPMEHDAPQRDPLNFGADRQLGLLSAAAVVLRPGARPSAMRLRPQEAVQRMARAAAAGWTVQVVSLARSGEAAADRLQRAASFLHRNRGAPAAAVAGGRVYLCRGEQVRNFPLRTFAQRPRACAVDPEAADFSVAPERAGRPEADGPATLVRVGVSQLDDHDAALIWRDASGTLLREQVPIGDLEDYLREAQELLSAGAKPCLLSVRLPGAPGGLARPRLPGTVKVRLRIGGELPFGLQLTVEGASIDLFARGGASAAAQAVLSKVPVGARFRACVQQIDVRQRSQPAPPLLRLYARSLALRRLFRAVREANALIAPGRWTENPSSRGNPNSNPSLTRSEDNVSDHPQ